MMITRRSRLLARVVVLLLLAASSVVIVIGFHSFGALTRGPARPLDATLVDVLWSIALAYAVRLVLGTLGAWGYATRPERMRTGHLHPIARMVERPPSWLRRLLVRATAVATLSSVAGPVGVLVPRAVAVEDAVLQPPALQAPHGGDAGPSPTERATDPTPPAPPGVGPAATDRTPQVVTAAADTGATAAEPARSGVALGPASVVVAPGDHLWSIAAASLASARGTTVDELPPDDIARAWRRLIELNRPRLRSGDPDLVFPGEVIHLPDLGDDREETP